MQALEESPTRRLYGIGSWFWDTQPSTFLTSYLAMVTGLGCGVLIHLQYRGERGSWAGLYAQSASMCMFQALGFGFTGMTFNALSAYREDDTVIGTTLGEAHSSWTLAWFAAMCCLPFCAASNLGSAIAFCGASTWLPDSLRAVQVAWGIAFLVALGEVYLFCTDQLESTSRAQVLWGMVASGLACLLVPLNGLDKAGAGWIFGGVAMRTCGFLVWQFAPEGCRAAKDHRAGCPFPEEFNHHAISNCLIAFSVLPIYYGVIRKSVQDSEMAYAELMREQAVEKYERAARTCCS